MVTFPLLHTRYRHLYDDLPSTNEIIPPSNKIQSLPQQNDNVHVTNTIDDNPRITWRRILLDFTGLLFMMILVFYFYMIARPPTVYFRTDDQSLMYPVQEPHVPSILVSLLSILMPIAVVILFNVFLAWSKWDLYSGLYGAILAYSVTLLLTSTLWMFVGGLRPHFMEKCDPDPILSSQQQGIYKTIDICRNKSSFNQDTFHGFPSGHASTSFAGCTFVSTYLASHLRMYRNGNAFKVFLFFLPFVCAVWLSVSRIADRHHSEIQVLVGIIIGIFSALFAYKIAYLNGFLFGHGRWAHVPYSRYQTI